MTAKDRIWVNDEFLAVVHTKQILNELKERLPKSHLRTTPHLAPQQLEGETPAFEEVTLLIPRSIWFSSYPTLENREIWLLTPEEVRKEVKK